MTSRELPPIDAHDHVDGPSDARLTLVEYADFECPFCVAAYPEIERARERFRGQLRFVFRHVPRSARDGFTKQAAEAAEAAAAQGAFWPMHGELFLHPGEHDIDRLLTHARHIGLDVARFQRELEGRVYAPRVKELAVRALRHGVVGVPTLFVGSERLLAAPKAETLAKAIETALGAKA